MVSKLKFPISNAQSDMVSLKQGWISDFVVSFVVASVAGWLLFNGGNAFAEQVLLASLGMAVSGFYLVRGCRRFNA
ncbi:hypothetical protein [Mesorhizobium sp. SP-1A]|uniref:hypothetical protein n=1 Tax=Mesorhizobium sp. SP-1A TaxID=3077840 RepID=UPI0028F6D35C|nr:hypothetical protein [Mesorhizobium sp. SP-1A]